MQRAPKTAAGGGVGRTARTLAWAVIAATIAVACNTAPTEIDAPVVGPYLQLRAVVLDDGTRTVSLRYDGSDGWDVVGTPWHADPRRVRALETAIRSPWTAIETRPAGPTREALGLGPEDGLRVRLEPERSPAVEVRLGVQDDGCVWVDAGGPSIGCVPGLDRRLFAPTDAWRDERVGGPREAEVVAVEAGTLRVERVGGVWEGRGGDANHQAVNRLVRALESASAVPTQCDLGQVVAQVRLSTATATTVYALGGKEPARCLAIDGEPAFVVDDYLAAQLRLAARSLELASVPDLGGPTIPWDVTVDAGPERGMAEYPRPFVLALSHLRARALAARAFDVLPWLPPSRVITLRRSGHPGHRVVLWWTDSVDGVLARVDDGPVFLAERGGALRAPLSPAP